MRIGFSARGWMLSAATGLVFLPSVDVEAQTFQTQRQPVTASSGTASGDVASDEKSAVQQQVDELYAKFGPAPARNEQKNPAGDAGSTANIAAKTAPAAASGVKTAEAENGDSEKPNVRQVAGESADGISTLPAAEPRKLLTRPSTAVADAGSKSDRGFFPTLFSRRKPSPPPAASPEPSGDGSVQDHLRKLYAQDGREMPPMELNQLPSTSTGQTIPPLPQAAALEPLPRLKASTPQVSPQAEPIQRVSNNPFKRLIQKISPFRKKKADPKPIPAPAAAIAEQRALETQPLNPYFDRKPESAKAEDSDDPVFSEPAPLEPAELPAIEAEAPAKLVEPSALPEFKPLVELPEAPEEQPAAEPQIEAISPPSLDVKLSDKPFGAEEAAETAVDPLENPFPSLSEEAADKPAEKSPAPAKPDAPAAAEENPFTGLKLEVPAPKPAPEPQQPEVKQTVKPKADPALPPLSGTSEKKTLLSEAGAPKLIVRPQSRPAPTVPEIADPPAAQSSAAEKMKKIAERSELKGLKGFCPVQLRDERELRDARPQFTAEHDGVKYHFSSAAARQKFLAKPELYAPAASGQDVVLTSGSKEKAEGSLDHAVWYRDRLYLFQSPETLKSFVASPAKYAGSK